MNNVCNKADWNVKHIEGKKIGENIFIINQLTRQFWIGKDDFFAKALKESIINYEAFERLQNVLLKINPHLRDSLKSIQELLTSEEVIEYSNPKSVYIEITNKCNLKCKYCYNESQIINDKFFDYRVLETLLNEISQNYKSAIVISGGEPLLHPNFSDILKMCTENNIPISVFTNGTKLRDLSKEIINSKANLVVSLDGCSSKEHDYTRGVGSFDRMVNGLTHLLESGFSPKRIGLSFIINTFNKNNIEGMIEFAAKYGISRLTFVPVWSRGRGKDIQDDIFLKEELVGYWKELHRLSELHTEIKMDGDVFWQASVLKNGNYMPLNCSICNKLRIDIDGNIYPCPFIDGSENVMGNIGDSGDRNTLFSGPQRDKWSEIRYAKVNKTSSCGQCIFRGICQGGCMAKSYSIHNDFYGIDDECGMRIQFYEDVIKNINN